MCVTWQSHQALRQQQQINFAEATVLIRLTTRVTIIWEFYISYIWSYGKLFMFTILASGAGFQNTGLLPASAKLEVKYRPSGNAKHTQLDNFRPAIFYTIIYNPSCLHSIFPKCMITWVVVFEGRVTRVVYDDTHQALRRCWKTHFETKKQSQKWKNWSLAHLSVRWRWIILLSADCCLSQ